MIASLVNVVSLLVSFSMFFMFPWLPTLAGYLEERLPLPENQVVVLMYHHISPNPEGKITITAELFSQHLDKLISDGYHVISLEQYTDSLEGKFIPPKKSVVITFDDGYESFYTEAYPELLKRNMPASVFVIAGIIDDDKDPLPRLTWQQMREMQDHGMSFYPHSFNSHYLADLYPTRRQKPCLAGRIWLPSQKRWETREEYINRVTADLKAAKETMERNLGKPILHFAWPYGKDSVLAQNIARQVGFKYFFYVDNRSFSAEPPFYYIPRLNAGNKSISSNFLMKSIPRFARKQDLSYLKYFWLVG